MNARTIHDFAVREGYECSLQGWFTGLWNALDIGVLITDLENRCLMCNHLCGEMFDLSSRDFVTHDFEEIRRRVRHLIIDPETWAKKIKEVYEEPYASQKDELELAGKSHCLERFTAPILNERGDAVARLWTFRRVYREVLRVLSYGDVVLDLDSRLAMVDGKEVGLTGYEFALLHFLLQNAGTALGREILFRRVWGYELAMNTNSLDVLISRVRKKVCSGGPEGIKIRTVYGYGYRVTRE